RRAVVVRPRGLVACFAEPGQKVVHRARRARPLPAEAVLIVMGGQIEFAIERVEQVASALGGAHLVGDLFTNARQELVLVDGTEPERAGGPHPSAADRTFLGRARDETFL